MDNLTDLLEVVEKKELLEEDVIKSVAIEGLISNRNSIGICHNLISLSETFADLSSCEILSLPATVRELARETVFEVCQILDLVNHLETESEEGEPVTGQSLFDKINPKSWTLQ